MNANHTQSLAERMSVFVPNREKFPQDRLLPFAGQWVAFNAEGTDIVAHGEDFEALARYIVEKGIDPQEVVSEYVEDGSICIGGADLL